MVNNNNLKVIPTITEQHQVIQILEDVKKEEYDTIIVFGYKNGEVNVHGSGFVDRTRIIGALEIAKHVVWDR